MQALTHMLTRKSLDDIRSAHDVPFRHGTYATHDPHATYATCDLRYHCPQWSRP